MESPGTADTKTSRASVSSPASAAALNGRLLWAWKLQEEQWEGKTSECSLPPPWQARTPAFIHLLHEKDPWTGLPSCSFSVVPTFFIFLGDFMKSGKMVLRPRMSTNLWQLSVPSGPIMAWSSTFRALLREIFFSLRRESCNLKLFRDRRSFELHYFKDTAWKGKLKWRGKSQRAWMQAPSEIFFKEPKYYIDKYSFQDRGWRQTISFAISYYFYFFLFSILLFIYVFLFLSY